MLTTGEMLVNKVNELEAYERINAARSLPTSIPRPTSSAATLDIYDGEIKDIHRGGKVVIKYPAQPGEETLLEPHEAREAVDVRPLAEWKRLSQEVKNGITYLNNRLTGNCEANYDCTQIFEVYRLVQAFDPSFAAQHIDAAWVDALATIPPRALSLARFGNPPCLIWRPAFPDLETHLS